MGLVVGGAATGFVVGILGSLVPDSSIAQGSAVVVIIAMVGRDFGLLSFALPENRRQVPQSVTRRGPIVASLQFGFEMGSGVRTYVTSSAPYALIMTLLLVANVTESVLAGAFFGAGRATMALWRYASHLEDSWDRLLSRKQDLLRVGCMCAVAASLTLLSVASG